MLPARDALSSVESAISQVRGNETRLDGALRQAVDDLARLRREEAEGFRALARVKLDQLSQTQVMSDLDAVEKRALAIIEGQRLQLETLGKRREQAARAVSVAETARHDRVDALEAAADAIEDLRVKVSAAIASEPEWRAARAAVGEAEDVARSANEKAKYAEADLTEKRLPYEGDPLFMYLWNRKHDSAEDRSGTFTRFFDRMVARLVGYGDAKLNYAKLIEIPLRLREHAAARAAAIDEAKAAVAAIERRALVAAGIEPLEDRAAQAKAALDQAEARLAEANRALDALDAERQKTLGGEADVAYGGAVELLAQSLAREDFAQLYREAFQTPTKADDQALGAISEARKRIAKLDAEVASIRSDIREAARRRGELEGARDRARAQGYDSPWGGFADQAAIGAVIGSILNGMGRGGDLDRVLRDQYRRREPRADPGFGGGWGQSGPWGGATGGGLGGGLGGNWGSGGTWGGGGGGGGGSSSGGGGGGGWRTIDKF
jgi:hypothetical protein